MWTTRLCFPFLLLEQVWSNTVQLELIKQYAVTSRRSCCMLLWCWSLPDSAFSCQKATPAIERAFLVQISDMDCSSGQNECKGEAGLRTGCLVRQRKEPWWAAASFQGCMSQLEPLGKTCPSLSCIPCGSRNWQSRSYWERWISCCYIFFFSSRGPRCISVPKF